jgi:hypothetical protein
MGFSRAWTVISSLPGRSDTKFIISNPPFMALPETMKFITFFLRLGIVKSYLPRMKKAALSDGS